MTKIIPNVVSLVLSLNQGLPIPHHVERAGKTVAVANALDLDLLEVGSSLQMSSLVRYEKV